MEFDLAVCSIILFSMCFYSYIYISEKLNTNLNCKLRLAVPVVHEIKSIKNIKIVFLREYKSVPHQVQPRGVSRHVVEGVGRLDIQHYKDIFQNFLDFEKYSNI